MELKSRQVCVDKNRHELLQKRATKLRKTTGLLIRWTDLLREAIDEYFAHHKEE